MDKVLKKEESYKTDYSIEDGEKEPLELSRIKTSYREFDSRGNVVLDIVYMEDGSQDRKLVFVRDGDKLLEEKMYIDDDQLSEHKIHEYEGGQLVKTLASYGDGTKDTIIYAYDDQGNLVSETTMDEDGEVEEKQVITRDGNGRVTSSKTFEDGNLDEPVREQVSAYNQQGQLVEIWEKDYLSDHEEKKTIERDAGGREKVVRIYTNGKLMQKNTYVRNEQGDAEEITEEKPGKRLTIRQVFDDKKQVVEQEFLDINGNLIYKINRAFDHQGNLKESRVQQGEAFFGGKNMYTITVEHEFYEG